MARVAEVLGLWATEDRLLLGPPWDAQLSEVPPHRRRLPGLHRTRYTRHLCLDPFSFTQSKNVSSPSQGFLLRTFQAEGTDCAHLSVPNCLLPSSIGTPVGGDCSSACSPVSSSSRGAAQGPRLYLIHFSCFPEGARHVENSGKC